MGRLMSEQVDIKEVELGRVLGIFDAIMMGLGSIVGTGVFVSIAIAAGVAGSNVVFSIVIAALVAWCNAMSSAQLAAACPVSGGSYEYGYRFIHPNAGFLAGWMFLAAKCASAATAALGFAGYLCSIAGLSEKLIIPIAFAGAIVLTFLVKSGIKRSSIINIVIVSITFISLICFIVAGSEHAFSNGKKYLQFYWPENFGAMHHFLAATALMFVAFTGYGRIATMGEEVAEPRLTIPVAILSTLVISTVLYIGIALISIGAAGSDFLAESASGKIAPLAAVAGIFESKAVQITVSIGAITAMLGVLLNLILGLSRVMLAMARRSDMPVGLAEVNAETGSPEKAVWAVGIIVALIVLIGNVKTTWSFSAFTVLIYYSITNLAAIRMPKQRRIYPIQFAWAGLIGCLSLAFWIDSMIWFVGLLLIVFGFVWKLLMQASDQ